MNREAPGDNRLFAGLDDARLERLLESGEVYTVSAGTVLVEEGAALEALSVIVSGTVSVYLPQTARRPAPVRLTTFTNGDCFGEYAFIDSRPASASIRAVDEVTVFRIAFRRLLELVDEDNKIGLVLYRNLLAILVERLRAANAELDLFSGADDEEG